MKTITLGNTGLKIFPLIFGTLPMGPLQSNMSPVDGGRLIRTALDMGVNMIDTADMYGTYPHISEALKGFKNEVIVATKTHATDAATAESHIDKALRELGRETLDLVHIHGARVANPFTDRAAVIERLLKLKEQGKIRHIGLSTHFVNVAFEAADHPDIEVLHPLINKFGMGLIGGKPEDMASAISVCASKGKGIYAMKALAGGNHISGARDSIKFVMELDGVDAVAIGMLTQEEISANVRLFDTGEMDEAQWTRLETGRKNIRVMSAFCKGCGKCVDICASEAVTLVNGRATINYSRCIMCGYCASACPDFLFRFV